MSFAVCGFFCFLSFLFCGSFFSFLLPQPTEEDVDFLVQLVGKSWSLAEMRELREDIIGKVERWAGLLLAFRALKNGETAGLPRLEIALGTMGNNEHKALEMYTAMTGDRPFQ